MCGLMEALSNFVREKSEKVYALLEERVKGPSMASQISLES